MQEQLLCPWCMSSEIFRVSMIPPDDDTLPGTYYDIFFHYRCDNCKREGPEYKNDDKNAWLAFKNKSLMAEK